MEKHWPLRYCFTMSSPADTSPGIAIVDPSAIDARASASPPIPGETEEKTYAALLATPPAITDSEALDILFAGWPRDTANSASPELLAVARNLACQFGLPGRTPLAASRAWRMLDPATFEAEFAAQLTAIETFIRDWQTQRESFLILEFGEIELIESLFEALPPGRHAALLTNVMNFKVLSGRRLGLLRRIPMRLRKTTAPMLAAQRHSDALTAMADAKALLERIADPLGFAPIVEAANSATREVEKLMRQAATAAASNGGTALARIDIAQRAP